MKDTMKVTAQASIQRIRWADHETVEKDGREERLPMLKVTVITRGEVAVEVDFDEIVLEVARTALSNRGQSATALNGKIRAKVLTSKVEERREPSIHTEARRTT